MELFGIPKRKMIVPKKLLNEIRIVQPAHHDESYRHLGFLYFIIPAITTTTPMHDPRIMSVIPTSG